MKGKKGLWLFGVTQIVFIILELTDLISWSGLIIVTLMNYALLELSD